MRTFSCLVYLATHWCTHKERQFSELSPPAFFASDSFSVVSLVACDRGARGLMGRRKEESLSFAFLLSITPRVTRVYVLGKKETIGDESAFACDQKVSARADFKSFETPVGSNNKLL